MAQIRNREESSGRLLSGFAVASRRRRAIHIEAGMVATRSRWDHQQIAAAHISAISTAIPVRRIDRFCVTMYATTAATIGSPVDQDLRIIHDQTSQIRLLDAKFIRRN